MKTNYKTSLLIFAATIFATGCGGAEEPVSASGELLIPNRAGIYTEATEHYGPLYVREVSDADEAGHAVADTRPWASYWYPLRDSILVKPGKSNGGQATLDKYDKYSKAVFGKSSSAVQEEIRTGLYNDRAEGWEGRCHAWAVASVLEMEPVLPAAGVKIPGSDVTFFTRDVKALMIKAYEFVDNDAFRLFGRPFALSDDDAQDFQDIYPDQFHRVLQAELYERSRPIIIDDVAGSEVWNSPIFEAVTVMQRDASDPHVMHVSTYVQGAQSMDTTPDWAGPQTPRTYELYYDLMGIPQADGSLLVKYGKWTGKSIKDHPDFVMALPPKGEKVKHWSANKQLDLDVIGDIMAKTRAFTRRLEMFGSPTFTF